MFVAFRAALYATGFIALWVWLAISLRPLDARLGLLLPIWVRPIGAVLAVTGALLALSCVILFVKRGRGTPAPFDPPREFVATGPYRLVRNPMYIGGLSLILGFGLILRSASISALALIFFVVMHLFVMLYEEPALENRFGSSYLTYKRSVPRWLPSRATRSPPDSRGVA
ncbi:isoprenylcysteine carboxylmethyltransferase family protein [Acidobacteria bacterium AH-259-L09]|nr:isoprenylcysteine carboxylmethyltransferase family protein [Acidobacteria bacterium AH-259-L09]